MEKTYKGKVQIKTINSVKVNNLWFKFFETERLTQIYPEDNVIITYKENTKDGKLYRNGINIEIIPPISNPELTYENENTGHKQMIPDTTVNTILMISEKIYSNENTKVAFDEIVKDILKGYKEIINY